MPGAASGASKVDSTGEATLLDAGSISGAISGAFADSGAISGDAGDAGSGAISVSVEIVDMDFAAGGATSSVCNDGGAVSAEPPDADVLDVERVCADDGLWLLVHRSQQPGSSGSARWVHSHSPGAGEGAVAEEVCPVGLEDSLTSTEADPASPVVVSAPPESGFVAAGVSSLALPDVEVGPSDVDEDPDEVEVPDSVDSDPPEGDFDRLVLESGCEPDSEVCALVPEPEGCDAVLESPLESEADESEPGCAHAMPGVVATATPTPSATASAPTRPTYLA